MDDDILRYNLRRTVSLSGCGASLDHGVAGRRTPGRKMATEVHQTDACDRDEQQTNSFCDARNNTNNELY